MTATGTASSRPIPYDQRLARRLVGPFARAGATPNQVTVASLVLALLAAWLFAAGGPAIHWGAAAFVLARFLDQVDGELARRTGQCSRLGYYLDYATGGLSYAALFLGIGLGLSDGPLGAWAFASGILGAAAAFVSLAINLRLDRRFGLREGATVGYPAFGGFELEDGSYLIAPVTWLGWLGPFFLAASLGAAIYCLWSLARLLRPDVRQP